jgi:hypothetical protein
VWHPIFMARVLDRDCIAGLESRNTSFWRAFGTTDEGGYGLKRHRTEHESTLLLPMASSTRRLLAVTQTRAGQFVPHALDGTEKP